MTSRLVWNDKQETSNAIFSKHIYIYIFIYFFFHTCWGFFVFFFSRKALHFCSVSSFTGSKLHLWFPSPPPVGIFLNHITLRCLLSSPYLEPKGKWETKCRYFHSWEWQLLPLLLSHLFIYFGISHKLCLLIRWPLSWN